MINKRLIFGIIFIAVGVICISVPLTYDWYTTHKNQELVDAMNLLKRDGLDEDQKELNWSREELESVYHLEIPSIKLEQFVLPETTEENLAISLTQIKSDQNPELDNISIAGHRGYRSDRHFSQLPNVREGEEILLETDDKRFVYKVSTIMIVEATQVDVLDNNGPEITLITCTISGEERVVVKGTLVEVQELL